MKEFKFPDVGEGIHEGRIVKWHVSEGDTVKADQVLVEVETDKAVVELPSPYNGIVRKINFHEGTMVKVGEALVAMEDTGGAPGVKQPAAKTAQPPQPPAAAEFPAATPLTPAEESVPETLQPFLTARQERILATPATRKLARELGVDIAKVSGSGTGGRITDEDVRRATGKMPAAGLQFQTPGSGQPETPKAGTGAVAGARSTVAPRTAEQIPMPAPPKSAEVPLVQVHPETGDVRIPLTGWRKAISDRMAYSKSHIPHACGMDFVDVTALVRLREKEKQIFEPRGIHFTYLPFVVKACVVALRKFPSFNAHFDAERNELVAKKSVNIGIAVDTPDGLVVPVIRNADERTMVDIAVEIERLAGLAKERKLHLDDIKGGTFTITNVGSLGGFFSTPVIDPPQVAIMAIHRIRDMPLVVEGRVEARKVMGISMCFDHRVVDGALATEFMNVVMKHLEDPDLLLVDMV